MDSRGFFRSIIAGSGERPTRFHDDKGNRVPFASLWYAPHAFVTTFLRACFGYRPPIPWLSYRAQRQIARILGPDKVVLEFGSGMSTLWLARRCGQLYSFEDDETWYRRVQAGLLKMRLPGVQHHFRDQVRYPDVSDFPDQSFDFVLIDGSKRPDCVRNALPKLKPGGWIYLDNTDRFARIKPESEYQEAERLLFDAVRQCNGTVRYFTDFVPTNFVAKQGMLAQYGR